MFLWTVRFALKALPLPHWCIIKLTSSEPEFAERNWFWTVRQHWRSNEWCVSSQHTHWLIEACHSNLGNRIVDFWVASQPCRSHLGKNWSQFIKISRPKTTTTNIHTHKKKANVTCANKHLVITILKTGTSPDKTQDWSGTNSQKLTI